MKTFSVYNKKRQFSNTPEPEGIPARTKNKQLKFFIQRHDASHLHYDFRLELNGVLKSWAIPKGPSMNPRDKRLALMVEDHPLSYGSFAGTIPKGNYGAGTVEAWDEGIYEPENQNGIGAEKTIALELKKGSLKFVLHGDKLKGSFALIRLKNAENSWLLIKHKDEYALENDHKEINRLDMAAKPKKKSVKRRASKVTSMNKMPESAPETEKDKSVEIDGHTLHLTNLNKLYWPEENITKRDLIDYYNSIAKYILPYLKDRPQSLKRNPNGIVDKGFYQKDAGGAAPPWIKTKSIHSASTDKDVHYILCNDTATLIYLNNLGCIEINTWNSTTKHLDKPDYMIIDIDPSKNNSFDQVIDAALVTKDVLDKAGAPAYCKTSGASGIHIYVPFRAAYTYDQIGQFAELIAHLTQLQLPQITTLERPLSKRKGRIYLDYLQNNQGQTLASPYSVRPVAGACVSTPLHWNEVKHGLSPLDFTIFNMKSRLDKEGDLFSGVLSQTTDLKKCIKRLEG